MAKETYNGMYTVYITEPEVRKKGGKCPRRLQAHARTETGNIGVGGVGELLKGYQHV